MRVWTASELRTLRRRYPDERAADVAEAMGRTPRSIYQKATELGLRKSAKFLASDRSGRIIRGKQHPSMIRHQFQRGHATWNKGLHYRPGGRCAETQFRKGELHGMAAQRLQPLGATRLDKDGNLIRKISHDGCRYKRWRSVHSLVWEAANGPIPSGHVVVFKSGRHTAVESEITLERLELVSRAENMRRNSYLTRYPKEVGDLMRLRGALKRKINNRSKRREKQNG